MKKQTVKKIWIDLDNSPHVPFFRPIMAELEKRGYTIVLTVRDAFQVIKLADLFGLRYHACGRHYGKNRLMKVAGLCIRTLQLLPHILRTRPAFSVSHGSRSLILLSRLLRIPSLSLDDYEHSNLSLSGDWVMVPEVIPRATLHFDHNRLLTYPGIKEDVYVPSFEPDPAILADLGVAGETVLTTIRPPATEAHYHNPESEQILDAVMEHCAAHPAVFMVMVCRSNNQKDELSRRYSRLIADNRLVIPHKVYDGLNLIWHSDLVVSGGGTMNREAAALRVPVYSIFRGAIGAVDRFLQKEGRLVLIESAAQAGSIVIAKRPVEQRLEQRNNPTLTAIVAAIDTLCRTGRPAAGAAPESMDKESR